jgi:hypothetical protein
VIPLSLPTSCRVVLALALLAALLRPVPQDLRRPNAPEVLATSAVPFSADATVEWFRADQPSIKILRAITADLDDDGDLDVVTVTADVGVTLWLNEGFGHFVRQAPRHAATLTGADHSLAGAGRDTGPSAPTSPKWWYPRGRVALQVPIIEIRTATVVVQPQVRASERTNQPARAPPPSGHSSLIL